jgi:hypothetical protein
MTHDELKKKLIEAYGAPIYHALCAVVELHSQGNLGGCGDEECCGRHTPDICVHCHYEYPCDTVQAIIGELG